MQMLEIQGKKCKKFSMSPLHSNFKQGLQPKLKKRSVQISLFLNSQLGYLTIEKEKEKEKLPPKIQFYSSAIHQGINKDIVLSSELPSVPFYMPKLLSRTPSPLRVTRAKLANLRMNLYSPNQGQERIGTETQRRTFHNKLAKEINKSLNLPNGNTVKQKNKIMNKTLKRFRLVDLEVQLPDIISLRKNYKKNY